MHIALVDDEEECLKEMADICREFGVQTGQSVQTTCFRSGDAFLDAFARGRFDAIFLDVFMPGLSGVATALKMRETDNRCLIVFVTTSSEFMPDAFSCHAFEYITKPISKERFVRVLSDAVRTLPASQQMVELSAGRKTAHVPLETIASAVTDAHYVELTLADGGVLRCRMTMGECMEKLQHDDRFILINKGIVVNAEYIAGFENGCCILDSGARFPLRVRDRARIQQQAADYNFRQIRRRQAHCTKE